MENADYRQFLREELLLRLKRNPAYSARALARDLELSAPFFSQILSGKRLLAEDRAQSIANKMTWPRWKKSVFLKLVHYGNIRDEQLRQTVLREVKTLLNQANSRTAKAKFRRFKPEEFSIVADWQHSAIYELTQLKSFKDDPEWIAKKLGLPRSEVDAAIERLLRVRLLERTEGQLRQTKGDCKMGATPSQAIRNFHAQHLEKARKALENQPLHERDFTGTTFPIDVKQLPRAKALIRRFNHELMQLMQAGEQKSAVYHLAVQLYRVDQKEE